MHASLPSPSYKPPVAHITNFSAELLLAIGAHLPLGSLAAFALVSRTIRQTVQPALDFLRLPTCITDLPSELIVDIASRLPLGSLAAFSLTSRDVRGTGQPVLYKKLELRCDGPEATQPSQRATIRRVLASIAEDPERCEMLRELDLRDWGWMGQQEMARLKVIVEYAQRMSAIKFTESHDAPGVYVPFFPPVWDVILALPALETLDCHFGPVVPIQLQRSKSLRRFKAAEFGILASEDGSLPPLEYLDLEFVSGITEDWLTPSLMRSLKTLKLRGLDVGGVDVVANVFRVAGNSSTVETLVVDLDFSRAEAPPPTFRQVSKIVVGATLLPRLRSLEVHPLPGASVESTLQLFERTFAAGRATKMENLILRMSKGWPIMWTPSDVARICSLLGNLPNLRSFGTDVASMSEPGDGQAAQISPLDQAQAYFETHRGLQRVTIPGTMILAGYWVPSNRTETLSIFERQEGGVHEVEQIAHWHHQELQEVDLLWDLFTRSA